MTNLASRMQTAAPVGSIAVTEATRNLCEGYFTLKPLGPTRVKGVTEPVNVYEVTGLGPLRTRLQRSAGRGLSKFVGRDREMNAMEAAAERAKSGHGQIVSAMAEAGTGKSRLFFEFKAKNQSGWMVLETFSVSHGKASAYLPVIELLWNYFKINSDDDERARREKVTGRVLALERVLEDTLPYLFALLAIVEGEDPLTQMDGQIKKRRTLDAIKRIMLRESLNQPLMVVFEDLHWINDETQALLNLLADSIPNSKILMLVNYRPEYSHQWGSKTYYTQLRLDPLGKENADEMLTAMVGDAVEIRSLKQLIIERTQGNPFFMEETVQVLLDEGALVYDGATARLTKPLGDLKIPPTVQAILAARIDRLGKDEKDLLQTLAVIGKEFPLSLIRAVTAKSADELNTMLGELQLGEFIYEQPAVGDVEYTFKHALTQEVAYGSVLNERRKMLHDRAGEAIEALYADRLDDHLGELAHHFTHGINADKAVRYLMLAARQSLERFAYQESEAQVRQGLKLLRTLPDSPENEARESDLVSALVQALWRTKGPGAPETQEVINRAAALAENAGDSARQILQLSLMRVSIDASGDYASGTALADQILKLAEREGSPRSFAAAHHAKLLAHYYRGDLAGAETCFARWCELPASAHFKENSTQRVVVPGIASYCAWLRGHPELARERVAKAIEVALRNKDPLDLVVGRGLESTLFRLLKDHERAEASATLVLSLSDEHGINAVFRGIALAIKGWVRAQLGGGAGEGVSLIREGLAYLIERNLRVYTTDAFICLAEAQALGGMTDDALITIEEALKANSQEVLYRPEALRERGELRQKVGQDESAEADFRTAIVLAQKISAKMLELRATVSLSRLLDQQGKHDEARAMLADIYGWFTEGFDTADLKDAKALLDELGS